MDNVKITLEKKSRSSEQSMELLEEIIEEILSRLPTKSLLRFRCVSQSWRSLIASKLFIKTHLQNLTKKQIYAHKRVIYNCTEHGLKQCSMQRYFDEPSVDPSPFDDPKNNHLMTAGVIVVGHCNGVLCILKKPGYFFLWNPTTRISIELPKLEHVTTTYGFGWDEGSDAYKVFAVVSEKEKNIGKVYSTKTNSWKTVKHRCLSLCGIIGVFTCGKIHWLKEGGHYIETFDLNSEVFGMIDTPCKPEVGGSMRVYEDIGGCLGVACQSNNKKTNKTLRLWVMKQYGVKKSWVERIVSSSKIYTCCKPVHTYIESLVSPEYEKNS